MAKIIENIIDETLTLLPEDKRKTYIVKSSTTTKGINKVISDHLNQGWKLQGGISGSQYKSTSGYYFSQALINF